MRNRKRTVISAAIVAIALASPAVAQSAGSTTASEPSTSQSQTAPGGMMQGQGAMGQNMPMRGQVMMGQGMMGQGMMGQGGGMGMGAMMGRHVEGWIAFLKTELKITPAQEKQWDAVATAMRANAAAMRQMRGGMMAAGAATSLPERLTAAAKLLSARLDGLHKYQAAVDPLYAALSDDQKKTADELMPGPMGMGMGGGMMGGGMMGRMGMR